VADFWILALWSVLFVLLFQRNIPPPYSKVVGSSETLVTYRLCRLHTRISQFLYSKT